MGRNPDVEPATHSPLESALARVGDRWSFLVVDALSGGPLRFNELQEAVGGIATNVLSQRLKQLEARTIVVAEPYQARPLRYSYRLSAPGIELSAATRMLAQWGSDNASSAGELEHSACGSPLQARWYCPTCELAVSDGEVDAGSYL